MLAKLTPLLTFIAAVDGAVAAIFAALSNFAPSTTPMDNVVIAVCGTVGTIVAVVAKLTGTNPITGVKS